jgi:hypothetical protein
MAAKAKEQKAAEEAAKKTEALTDGLKAAGVTLSGSETPEEIEALAEKHGVKVLSPEEAAAAEKAAKNAAKNADPITVKYRDHKASRRSAPSRRRFTARTSPSWRRSSRRPTPSASSRSFRVLASREGLISATRCFPTAAALLADRSRSDGQNLALYPEALNGTHG